MKKWISLALSLGMLCLVASASAAGAIADRAINSATARESILFMVYSSVSFFCLFR